VNRRENRREIELDKALIVAALVFLVSLGWITGAPIFEPFGAGRLTAMTVFGFPLLLAVLLLRRASGGLKTLVVSWWPVFGILAVYESLKHMHANRITEWLGIRPKDELMLRIDEALFGKALPLWMDSWTAPWFQDLMSFLYIWVYYLGPFTLLAVAYLQRREDLFRRLRLGLVLGLLGGYVLYILVPVAGPLFLIGDQFQHAIRTQSRLETLVFDTLRFNWDCFPSLHTAIPWILTVLCWGRFPRWVSALSALLASGVTLSTVALRFHYGVDLLAAFVWVAVVCAVVVRLARRDYGRIRIRRRRAPRRPGAARTPARAVLGRIAIASAFLAGAASVASVALERWLEAWLLAPLLAGAGIVSGTALGLGLGVAAGRRAGDSVTARLRVAAASGLGAAIWIALLAAPSRDLSLAGLVAASLARLGADAAGPAGTLVAACWSLPLGALVGSALTAMACGGAALGPNGAARRTAGWAALGGAVGLLVARAELVPRIGYGDTVLLGALAAALAAWWLGRATAGSVRPPRSPSPATSWRGIGSWAVCGMLLGAVSTIWLFVYPAAVGESARTFGTVATAVLAGLALALQARPRGGKGALAAGGLFLFGLALAVSAPLWAQAPMRIARAAAHAETLVAIERIRFLALLALVVVPTLLLAFSLRGLVESWRGQATRPLTVLLGGVAAGAGLVAFALVPGVGTRRTLAGLALAAGAGGVVGLLRRGARWRTVLGLAVTAPALLIALSAWDLRPLAAGSHLDLGRRVPAVISASEPTEDPITGFVARFDSANGGVNALRYVSGSGLVHAVVPDPSLGAVAMLAVENARTPRRALVLGTSPAAARALVGLGVRRVEMVTPSAAVLAATLAAEGEASGVPAVFETEIGSEGGPYDVVLSKLDDFWLGLARGSFNREFYALIRTRLAPGGVFVQTISLDAVGIREVGTIVASLARELPRVSLRILGRHLVLLATIEPQKEGFEPAAVARMQPWQVERWLAFTAPAESSDRASSLSFRVPNYRVAGDISAATASALVALASGRAASLPVPAAPTGGSPVQRPATHQPAAASRIPG